VPVLVLVPQAVVREWVWEWDQVSVTVLVIRWELAGESYCQGRQLLQWEWVPWEWEPAEVELLCCWLLNSDLGLLTSDF
jgi:hypothetical protein